MKRQDVLIIGGGIIGGSIAYELSQYQLNVSVLEANPVLADETTAANSGAIHGGFDPDPGKVEAELNYRGNRKWVNKWFKHLSFARAQVDSLVIAYSKTELPHIKMLYERGMTNGLKQSEMAVISKSALRKLEPKISVKAEGALLCNISWLIDPVQATHALFGAAKNNGTEVFTGAKVVAIERKKGFFAVATADGRRFEASIIVNAAGHYADILAEMAGFGDFKQTTRRGEYRVLDRVQRGIVRNICFMIPTIHGKGVLVAPMLNGNILIGPTALEGVPKEDARLVTPEMFEKIGAIAKNIIPSIDVSRTIMTFAGSRPIDIETNDFVIRSARDCLQFINAAGMQSPGISSAPCIAEEVVKLVQKAGLPLKKRSDHKADFSIG